MIQEIKDINNAVQHSTTTNHELLPDRWYTRMQAAAFFGIKRVAFDAWIDKGLITGVPKNPLKAQSPLQFLGSEIMRTRARVGGDIPHRRCG